MELLALIGLTLSIAGVVRFWKQRRQIAEQNSIKFAGKALSQTHDLASLLDKVDRTFTPDYLASLERELDPQTFAGLVAQVSRARAMRGEPGGPSMESVGRKLAMAAIDEPDIRVGDLVHITVLQERLITDLRDYFRPYFAGGRGETD